MKNINVEYVDVGFSFCFGNIIKAEFGSDFSGNRKNIFNERQAFASFPKNGFLRFEENVDLHNLSELFGKMFIFPTTSWWNSWG